MTHRLIAPLLAVMLLTACQVEFTAPTTTTQPLNLAANDFSTIHKNNGIELMQAMLQMGPGDEGRVNFNSASYTGPTNINSPNVLLGQSVTVSCGGVAAGQEVYIDLAPAGTLNAQDERRFTVKNCNIGNGWQTDVVSSDIVNTDTSRSSFAELATMYSTNHVVVRAIHGTGYTGPGGGDYMGSLYVDGIRYGTVSAASIPSYPDDGRMNPGWTLSGNWRGLPISLTVTLSGTTYTYTLTTSADSSKLVATVPNTDTAALTIQVTDKTAVTSTLSTTKAQLVATALSPNNITSGAAVAFQTITPANALEIAQGSVFGTRPDLLSTTFGWSSYTGQSNVLWSDPSLGQTNPVDCNGSAGGTVTLVDRGTLGALDAGDVQQMQLSNCNTGGNWRLNGWNAETLKSGTWDNGSSAFLFGLNFSNGTQTAALRSSLDATFSGALMQTSPLTALVNINGAPYGMSAATSTSEPAVDSWSWSGRYTWRGLLLQVSGNENASGILTLTITARDSSKLQATWSTSSASIVVTDKAGTQTTLTYPTGDAEILIKALSS